MIFSSLFKDNFLYVKLFKNEVEFLDVQNGQIKREKSTAEFSSSRLIIADFDIAENFLKDVLRTMKTKTYKAILVHPMEFTVDGVSQVEERVFVELFERLGGRLIKIHVGNILNSKQVIEKLKN